MKTIKLRLDSKKLAKWLAISAAATLILHLGLQYLNLLVYNEQNGFVFELSNRLDLGDESSLPTWLSQFLLLLLAFFAWVASREESQAVAKRLWRLIALAGLVASIDEIAAGHELSLQTIHNHFFHEQQPTLVKNAWLIVGPAVIAAGLAFLLWAYRILPRRTFWLLTWSAVLFGAGAVGVDWLSSGVDPATFLSQGWLVGLEETLEIVGSALAVYATVEYLETRPR